MREAVESYGRTLSLPPQGQLPAGVDVIELEGAPPRRLYVVLPLVTQEEGLSDLNVEMMLTQVAPQLWLIAIENIHVL